jgi:hypothetical protein
MVGQRAGCKRRCDDAVEEKEEKILFGRESVKQRFGNNRREGHRNVEVEEVLRYHKLSGCIASALIGIQGAVEAAFQWPEAEAHVDSRRPSTVKMEVVSEMKSQSLKSMDDLKVMLPSLLICERWHTFSPTGSAATRWGEQTQADGKEALRQPKTEAEGAVATVAVVGGATGWQSMEPCRDVYHLPQLVKYAELEVVAPQHELGIYTMLLQQLRAHDMLHLGNRRCCSKKESRRRCKGRTALPSFS